MCRISRSQVDTQAAQRPVHAGDEQRPPLAIRTEVAPSGGMRVAPGLRSPVTMVQAAPVAGSIR
ncbi:hypothetical protein D5S18_29560 [Nocardia panacis]|uniref:Uncharacterized protein n=1 Tax=Nocardia panacis TaxID=2340916 RepID=A0A3A4KCJ3_9NOCA|nr:hypothetical protein D5S18_29560 [Nocardia panacis]